MKKIIDFKTQAPAPSIDYPRPDRLVTGNPQRQTWTHYNSSATGMEAGIWACEPGAWRIAFADNKEEFFSVIRGIVRLHDDAGKIVEVKTGESAIIPAGFTGMFEVVEAVEKYFVLVEANTKEND